MTTREFNHIKMYKFSSYKYAQSFANRATNPMAIILGDDGKYWVTSLADGERLTAAGYEFAE